MEDMAYQALMAGDSVVAWVAAALLALLLRWVQSRISSERARTYLTRAVVEIADAVADVWQTYVSDLKASNADGKLSSLEKREAKAAALKKAKALIGKEGLARLARILGTDALDSWIETKIESAVDARKADPT